MKMKLVTNFNVMADFLYRVRYIMIKMKTERQQDELQSKPHVFLILLYIVIALLHHTFQFAWNNGIVILIKCNMLSLDLEFGLNGFML